MCTQKEFFRPIRVSLSAVNKAIDLAFRLCVDQTRRMPKLRAFMFFREDKLMKTCLRHPMIQEECLVIGQWGKNVH